MDLIFYNGKIMTVETDNPQVEAIAIKGNKISNIGSNEEILALQNKHTKVIDLEGKLMLPGFIDTHIHLNFCSVKMRNVDLVGSQSPEEIIKRLSDYIEKNNIPEGQWVVGEGWNQDNFEGEKRFPNKFDLDKVSTKHPIYVARSCYHITGANSKALEVCNITKDTVVEGGEIDLGEDGTPNGVLRETAGHIVRQKAKDLDSVEQFKETIEFIMPYLHKQGITSAHSEDLVEYGNKYDVVFQGYKELQEEGKLQARIYFQSRFSDPDELAVFIEKGYITGKGDDYFKLGPIKLLADGSLGGRTAALSRPYADSPEETGEMVIEPAVIDKIIEMANDNNMQTATHTIGDRAAEIVESAIEKALLKAPRDDHRHAIVHSQINTKETLEKYKELNIMALLQPIFLESDTRIVDARVGEELVEYSYDIRKFLDLGVKVAFGSDSPVEPFNCIHGIYHAVTMKRLDGFLWHPEKAITVEEAVKAFTLGGAYASFDENIKGSIKEGKLADLVVLSDDIYTIPADDIKDVNVVMTVFDGNIVFEQ